MHLLDLPEEILDMIQEALQDHTGSGYVHFYNYRVLESLRKKFGF